MSPSLCGGGRGENGAGIEWGCEWKRGWGWGWRTKMTMASVRSNIKFEYFAMWGCWGVCESGDGGVRVGMRDTHGSEDIWRG